MEIMGCLSGKERVIALVAGASLIISSTSCGTILHPERRGQPAGRLDPGIVVLDAVGLLLFFIPGVVAFAVDFSTGTIYLPPEPCADARTLRTQDLQTVRMSPAELTPQGLEAIVREHTGQTIRLAPGTYRAAKLSDISDLEPATLERLESSPPTTQVIFGRQ
jgi:hypothetical protein